MLAAAWWNNEDETGMLIRVFYARLKTGRRAAYERLCQEVSVPLMRAQSGCLTTHIAPLRADLSDDFIFVSLWKDLASLRAFVGEEWQQASILPGEADLLERVRVEHYDDSYHSLVQLWSANTEIIRRREAQALTAPLTDAEWQAVQRVLPPRRDGGRGRPRADDRRILDGILYVLRNGCRWQDLPASFGNAVTYWRRFVEWEANGTWEHIWRALLAVMDPPARKAWALAFLDSRYVPTKPGRRYGWAAITQ